MKKTTPQEAKNKLEKNNLFNNTNTPFVISKSRGITLTETDVFTIDKPKTTRREDSFSIVDKTHYFEIVMQVTRVHNFLFDPINKDYLEHAINSTRDFYHNHRLLIPMLPTEITKGLLSLNADNELRDVISTTLILDKESRKIENFDLKKVTNIESVKIVKNLDYLCLQEIQKRNCRSGRAIQFSEDLVECARILDINSNPQSRFNEYNNVQIIQNFITNLSIYISRTFAEYCANNQIPIIYLDNSGFYSTKPGKTPFCRLNSPLRDITSILNQKTQEEILVNGITPTNKERKSKIKKYESLVLHLNKRVLLDRQIKK